MRTETCTWLDAEVKHYIQRLRENGTAVSVALVQAAAESYLLGRNRTVLAEYGGHVGLGSVSLKKNGLREEESYN